MLEHALETIRNFPRAGHRASWVRLALLRPDLECGSTVSIANLHRSLWTRLLDVLWSQPVNLGQTRMPSISSGPLGHSRLRILVCLCLVLLVLTGWRILSTINLNCRMVTLLDVAVRQHDQIPYSSAALRSIVNDLATDRSYFSDQIGSALVIGSILLDEPGKAYRWLQVYPQAWRRVTVSE